ncbi:MAG TPA: hypothetical protein VN668_02270 [Stellaceae bacterium]|nr:hypothetical protein [Stellaceae bacterium]
MSAHLKHSRVTKALTDGALNVGFAEAEDRLSSVRLVIVLAGDAAGTAAGQAAALTAVATAVKCFSSATLVGDPSMPLVRSLPIGCALGEAIRALGGAMSATVPEDTTHVVQVGGTPAETFFLRCWWSGWCAGVRPSWDDHPIGSSANPLAGVFAGALAIREVFAWVRGDRRAGKRVSVVSLWEPWIEPEVTGPGPETVFMPSKLWIVGLGHLGQALLWDMAFLPKGIHTVLQDDQDVQEENQATGLLNLDGTFGTRKTRVAAAWLEKLGWKTSIIERRHYGEFGPRQDQQDDPRIIVTLVDDLAPRLKIARAGFDWMIDAGVGHGAIDFEMLQLRIVKHGIDPATLWSKPAAPPVVDRLLGRRAYKELAEQERAAVGNECGTFTLAQATVAVPFVGAAVGAILLSQSIRLVMIQETKELMQMELSSPCLVTTGRTNELSQMNLGTVELRML